MSLSSKRIVLVDPLGEVLFSGESVVAQAPGEEACPETKRSAAESGLFPAVKPIGSDRPAPEVTEAQPPETEAATQKRGGRAA